MEITHLLPFLQYGMLGLFAILIIGGFYLFKNYLDKKMSKPDEAYIIIQELLKNQMSTTGEITKGFDKLASSIELVRTDLTKHLLIVETLRRDFDSHIKDHEKNKPD